MNNHPSPPAPPKPRIIKEGYFVSGKEDFLIIILIIILAAIITIFRMI